MWCVILIEKSVGQNASYATKILSEDFKIYAACDSLCHRLLTEEIERKIHNRDQTTNLTENSVLKIGSCVHIMNRGKAVLEGTVTFHGIFGAMKKIENITLGKNHVMVKVEKIINKNYKPTPRINTWPAEKSNFAGTLG